MSNIKNVKSEDGLYIANTYARFPVEIVKGKGSLLYGADGKEYIDMGSGIAVNTFGLCDEEWIDAVTAQMKSFQHTSNLYYSEPCVELAKALVEKTGMSKVFFGNSGAEANECAIKVARKYAQEKKGKEYYNIVTLKNSFHGRTITTLSATGQDVFHKDYTPLTEGFLYAEANNADSVKQIIEQNSVAAVMLEVVQGEGGVLPLNRDFVLEVYELCKKEDVILIVDEVQTGNGRTGKLYGYMHYGILPDVFTTAKGLGNGLPIGACVLGEKVKDVFTPGTHGSTFGGNPTVCAGAISVINRLTDEFLAEVEAKSQYIFDRLKNAKGIISVDGLGLMIGIKTEKDKSTVIGECMENGVLCLSAKDKVRLLPALNIPFDLLKKAVDVIVKVCEG